LSYLDDSSDGEPPVVDPVVHLVLQIVGSQKQKFEPESRTGADSPQPPQNEASSSSSSSPTLVENTDGQGNAPEKKKKLANKKHIKLLKTLMAAVDGHPRFQQLMRKKDPLVDELLDLLQDVIDRFSHFPTDSIVWQLENVGTASPEMLTQIRVLLQKHFEERGATDEEESDAEESVVGGADLLVNHRTCEGAVLRVMGKLTALRSLSEDINGVLSPIFGGNLPSNISQSNNSSLFLLKNLRGMEACAKTVQDLQSLADALGIEKTVHGRDAATPTPSQRREGRSDASTRVQELFSEMDLDDLSSPEEVD
jgi:hypothetical protein